jgi:hypothetical protein
MLPTTLHVASPALSPVEDSDRPSRHLLVADNLHDDLLAQRFGLDGW